MRSFLAVAGFFGLLLAAVLLVAWGIFVPVRWFFGLEYFHALAMSLGTVGIATVLVLSFLPRPRFVTRTGTKTMKRKDEDEDAVEDEDEDEEDERGAPAWLVPLVPCNSGKPFQPVLWASGLISGLAVALPGWREGKK